MESKDIEKAVGTLPVPMEEKAETPAAPQVKTKPRRYRRWAFLLCGIGLVVYLFTLISSVGIDPDGRRNARDFWTGQEPWRTGHSPMGIPQHLQEMGRNAGGVIDQEDPPAAGTGIPLVARPAPEDASEQTPDASTEQTPDASTEQTPDASTEQTPDASTEQTPDASTEWSVPKRITLTTPQARNQGPSLPDPAEPANPPERQEVIQADQNPTTATDFNGVQSNAHISVDGNGTRISWRIPTTDFRAYHPQRHPSSRYPRGAMDNPPAVFTASCRMFRRGQQPPARFGRIRIPPDPSARPLPSSDSIYYWFRVITGYDINREDVDVSIGNYPAIRTTMALPMVQRELGPRSTVIDLDPLGIFQTFAEGRNAVIAAGNRRSISEIELPFEEAFRKPGIISARLCNSVSRGR